MEIPCRFCSRTMDVGVLITQHAVYRGDETGRVPLKGKIPVRCPACRADAELEYDFTSAHNVSLLDAQKTRHSDGQADG